MHQFTDELSPLDELVLKVTGTSMKQRQEFWSTVRNHEFPRQGTKEAELMLTILQTLDKNDLLDQSKPAQDLCRVMFNLCAPHKTGKNIYIFELIQSVVSSIAKIQQLRIESLNEEAHNEETTSTTATSTSATTTTPLEAPTKEMQVAVNSESRKTLEDFTDALLRNISNTEHLQHIGSYYAEHTRRFFPRDLEAKTIFDDLIEKIQEKLLSLDNTSNKYEALEQVYSQLASCDYREHQIILPIIEKALRNEAITEHRSTFGKVSSFFTEKKSDTETILQDAKTKIENLVAKQEYKLTEYLQEKETRKTNFDVSHH